MSNDPNRGRFLVSYYYRGEVYGAAVNGSTPDEAYAHIVAMFNNGTVIGERVAEVPVNIVTLAPVSLIARLWCWVRNLGVRS